MELTRSQISRKLNYRKATITNSNISKAYYKKAIQYGAYLEVYEYAQVQVTWKQERLDYAKKEEGIKLERSLRRAKNNIYKIAEANVLQHGKFPPVFFTLTFQANVTDLQQANLHFKYFIHKLNKFCRSSMAYIVVPEFQRRGAVHYHGLFFNLPFIPILQLRSLWGHGYVDFQLTRNLRSAGAYIAKYITKSIQDSRLYGQKLYYTSRNLLRPIHIFDDYAVDILERNPNMDVIRAHPGVGVIKIIYKKHD